MRRNRPNTNVIVTMHLKQRNTHGQILIEDFESSYNCLHCQKMTLKFFITSMLAMTHFIYAILRTRFRLLLWPPSMG